MKPSPAGSVPASCKAGGQGEKSCPICQAWGGMSGPGSEAGPGLGPGTASGPGTGPGPGPGVASGPGPGPGAGPGPAVASRPAPAPGSTLGPKSGPGPTLGPKSGPGSILGPGPGTASGPGPGPGSGTGTGPGSGPGAASGTGPGPGPTLGPKSGPGATAGPGPGPASGAGTGPGPGPGATLGPGPGASSGPGPGPTLGPKSGPGATSGPGPGPASGAGTGPGPGASSGPGPGATLGPGPGASSGPGPGASSGPGPGASSGPGPGPTLGPKSGPGATSGPGPRPGSGAGTGPASGPGPGSSAGPGLTSGPGPGPGVASGPGPGSSGGPGLTSGPGPGLTSGLGPGLTSGPGPGPIAASGPEPGTTSGPGAASGPGPGAGSVPGPVAGPGPGPKPGEPTPAPAPALQKKTQATPAQAPRQKVLVTGGGGYLGFSLGSRLAKSGASVILLDLRRPQWELLPGTEFIQADVRDEDALLRAFEGVDCVFHVASYGMSGAEKLQKEQIESINVGGTRLVVDVCVRRRVPRLVYTSTVNVAFGGRPIEQGDEDSVPYFPLEKHMDHYSRTKAIADQLTLMANGMPLPGGGTLRTCVLRPPGIYGPEEQRHLPRVASHIQKRLFMFRFGDRGTRMNWVHVHNLVQAHVLAAEALTAAKGYVASGQAYYINDGDSVNLFEWMAPLFEKLGYSQPWIQVPTSWVYLTAAVMEYLHLALRPICSIPPLLTRSEVHSVAVTHTFQIAKARAQLGYAPDKFSFADAVERYVQSTRGRPRGAPARTLLRLLLGLLLLVGLVALALHVLDLQPSVV